MGRARTDNEKAAFLAVIAGLLMLVSGVTGASQWRRTFDLIESFLGASPALRFVQLVFVVLGSVGGIFVLLGAYAFRNDRVRTGKIVILFGTGFTIASLILFLIIAVQRGELPFAGGAAIGFTGVVLSVFARFKAKAVPLT
ncbi:MAG: hypothetical protein E6K18_05885 [Methanobacteriota archaeon]|nr:MAG: hypothetical protein E6K18_05885 [Euryarchaeota archaeon]